MADSPHETDPNGSDGKDVAGGNAAEHKQPSGPTKLGRNLPTLLTVGVIVIVGGIAYGLYWSDGEFLLQLQNADVSRGLITFLVAVVTVTLSLLLVVWALTTEHQSDEYKSRFASAKEILSVLVGILGTILGFYFGSAEKGSDSSLTLSALEFREAKSEVVVYASGGTPPYRFGVESTGKGAKEHLSSSGWFFAPLPGNLARGDEVTVKVTDATNVSVTRTDKFDP